MKVKVRVKHIRMSPRKVRLVCDIVRGMDVEEALNQLQFTNKRAVKPLVKLINSAVANALHNHEIEKNNLFIDELKVDEGPTLSRWMPRAFGRATPIRKKTSQINLVLEEKVPSAKKKKTEKKKDGMKDDLVQVKDYKSVPKGQTPDLKGEDAPKDGGDQPSSKASANEEKKDEPFDKSRVGKHRAAEEMKGKEGGKKDKGFMKKIFKRKAD